MEATADATSRSANFVFIAISLSCHRQPKHDTIESSSRSHPNGAIGIPIMPLCPLPSFLFVRRPQTRTYVRPLRTITWLSHFSLTMARGNFVLLLATTAAALVSPASAFFGGATTDPSASASARIGTTPFERLEGVQLTSVSSGQPTLLTSQWRNNELLPWQNERCVIEFLRHYG